MSTLARHDAAPRPRRKVRRLAPYFRPYLGRTLLTVTLMLVITGTLLAGPALAQVGIDDGINAGDKGVLAMAVIAFVGVGAIGWLAGYYQLYLSSWVGQRVLLDLRGDTFEHLMGLQLGYHERTPTGWTVARLTSDIEALNQLVTDGATSLVINGLTLVGVIAILFAYDPKLALAAFLILPPLALGTAIFRTLSARLYRRARERNADVLAALQETLAGMSVVQGFGHEKRSAEEFSGVNERYRRANMSTIRLSGIYFPSVEMLGGIGMAVILYFGARRVLDADLTVGVMVAFLGYMSSFFDPIQQLSQLYNTFQAAMAALEKIFGVLDTQPELGDAPDAAPLPPIRGDIELRRVTFGYDGDAVLHDLDLHILPGQTVALVGPTGAGKSTLAKLIARLYDPDSGQVLVDGHDLRDVTQSSLRSQLAIVPQEGHLFAGTIADNLTFGRPEASESEVRAACEAIGILSMIESLPGGLDAQITEGGGGLSAGQRQLIAFARALVSDPRLLILDEATSSVDLRSEARIESAMDSLFAGRTAVVIAHRLSTIRGADRIAVIDGGRVVEQGTHDELIEAGGRYAELYADWEALPV